MADDQPGLAAARHDTEDSEGWELKRESWTFHRWFFEVYNRPMHKGEYTQLVKQMFKKAKPDLVVAGIYRLAMCDGSPIMITGCSGHLQTCTAIALACAILASREAPRSSSRVTPKTSHAAR
jgi:hypothetical protein